MSFLSMIPVLLIPITKVKKKKTTNNLIGTSFIDTVKKSQCQNKAPTQYKSGWRLSSAKIVSDYMDLQEFEDAS